MEASETHTRRYQSYLTARGALAPERGRKRNADFMSWVNGHAAAWRRENPGRLIICNQDAFDDFIVARLSS